MRITNKMMINNSIYWLSKQAERLSDAEIVSASGQVINKPSDDPAGAAKILEYRSAISKYDQYQTNIDQANTYIETGENVLDSVDSLLDEAIDYATEMASGAGDYTETYLSSIKDIYNSIIDLANTTYGSDYMYGGTDTDSTPFSDEIALSSGSADIGFYLGDDASTVTFTIYDSDGNECGTYTTSGTAGSNTLSWDGSVTLEDGTTTTLSDGDYTFGITASDSSGNAIASSCYQGDDGDKTMYISDSSTIKINRTGGEIFTEALSAISQLIAGLETGDDETIESCASAATESLDTALDNIKTERVALSNIYASLDVSSDRVDALSELLSEKLSAIETGDTTEAAVELSAQETAYEIATEAAAKILNLPKLSDYI